MARLIAIATLAVASVLVLGAFQTGEAAQAKAKGKKGAAPAATTFSGCVQKNSEGHYMLTNVSGGGSYELIGAPAGVDLAPHVGHKIDVTGKAVSEKQAARVEKEKGKAKKEERGERHLQVASIKMISTTCP